MIRFVRIISSPPRGAGPTLLGFAVGLAGGAAIGFTVQSQPAPAESARSVSRPASVSIPADVLRVLDGDTFEARVHVWPGLDITTKVRLRGIDAAELRARCPAERVQAEAARDALRDLLAQGAVGVCGVSLDKYGGRVVADAATRSTPNVSAEMLARGHARSYAGGHRDGWCDGQL
jgi:endonuclease YncB( thermonuclease family)